MKYWEPIKFFFDNILSSEGKEKTNVYAYMFLCDFFNFVLIIFGFSAFGVSNIYSSYSILNFITLNPRYLL